MAIYSFNGFIPVVKASSFIHPQACVTGNVIIGENVYIGPGAAIRGDWGQIIIEDGCNVQDNCTIHMFPGTKESIVGALCFVPANTTIPSRSVVVGNPAKIVKEVSDEMIQWKTEGTALYQQLPADCHASLLPCEPLREIEENRPTQKQDYFVWYKKK